jgi:hypothetical protein
MGWASPVQIRFGLPDLGPFCFFFSGKLLDFEPDLELVKFVEK